jgi:hypothetical protein
MNHFRCSLGTEKAVKNTKMNDTFTVFVHPSPATLEHREDCTAHTCHDKVYPPRSGRPTRSGPVRQDIFF